MEARATCNEFDKVSILLFHESVYESVRNKRTAQDEPVVPPALAALRVHEVHEAPPATKASGDQGAQVFAVSQRGEQEKAPGQKLELATALENSMKTNVLNCLNILLDR